MEKSADAFRTISEVADELVLPQHVLRFWETRFPQIRPLKRAGGRRYYRPVDVILLRLIRQLLYDEGYTIKGVQRLLKEKGVKGLREGLAGGGMAGEDLAGEATADEAVEGQVDDEPRDPAFDAIGGEHPFSLPMPAQVTSGISGAVLGSDDRASLRQALAVIEECERILRTLREPSF